MTEPVLAEPVMAERAEDERVAVERMTGCTPMTHQTRRT